MKLSYPSPAIKEWPIPGNGRLTLKVFFNLMKIKSAGLSPNYTSNSYTTPLTDQNGFRANPYKPTSSNRKVLIMVGDSFTIGHNVDNDQTYPSFTQKYSENNPGADKYIIHNAGVPGYGLDQEYIYINELIKKFSPNYLVWNLNLNDITDANDACLFMPNSKGRYINLPAYRNTLYIQGILIRHLPKFFRDSNIVNYLFKITQKGHERYTIGCTLPYTKKKEILERGIKKLEFYAKQLADTAKKQNVVIIYSLLPSQSYFSLQDFQNDDFSLQTYDRINELLIRNSAIFFDMNTIIAQCNFPDNTAARKQLNNYPNRLNEHLISKLKNPVNPVLVADLFQNDNFPYGYRHLTVKGNELAAEILTEAIVYLRN